MGCSAGLSVLIAEIGGYAKGILLNGRIEATMVASVKSKFELSL